MASNGESALQLVAGLEHLKISSGVSKLMRSPEDIIADARTYQAFLDEADYAEENLSVFVLTSPTYKAENGIIESPDHVVGIFISQRSAELWRDNAIPPVTDGTITEWGVQAVHNPEGSDES